MGHKSTKQLKYSKNRTHRKNVVNSVNSTNSINLQTTTVKLLNLTYDDNHKVLIGDIVIHRQKLYVVHCIVDANNVGISILTLPVVKNDEYSEEGELDYHTPKELILFQRGQRLIN